MTPFVLVLMLSLGSPRGHYTFLDEGEKAPFPGLLFDKDATAKVMATARLCPEECSLRLRINTETLQLDHQKAIDLLNIKLRTEGELAQKRLDLKDKHIAELQDLASGGFDWSSFFIGAGVGGAVVATAIAAIAISL